MGYAGISFASSLELNTATSRHNRHALIITIGQYADPATPPLPGTRADKLSATQIAKTMQVPEANIAYLQDDQATGKNIRKALVDLSARVQTGDRVYIHYSGHGTRFNDKNAGGCVEALLAYDGGASGTITNREMAALLKPISEKTDKLMVIYDACHSGGLVQSTTTVRQRSLNAEDGQGTLRPKFAQISEECNRPINIKTRNLLVETQKAGTLTQDIIHISASKDNEISFDDEKKGGLATQYFRDCLLRDAVDTDQSGAISVEEVKNCAQIKINNRLANDAYFKPHNLVLSGNASFVPAWFSKPAPAMAGVTTTPPPQPLTGEQALRQIFDQRDAKRSVKVVVNKEKLKIKQDSLNFSIQSNRKGYVYVAMAGSDNQSLYLLFPNEIDQDNTIQPDTLFLLPRPQWRIKAGGPAGTNHLLVLITDGKRDIQSLNANKAGPFVVSLNDSQGRSQLGAWMSRSVQASSTACAGTNSARAAECSDAFGAALFKIEEY
jgi:hypothetical protein